MGNAAADSMLVLLGADPQQVIAPRCVVVDAAVALSAPVIYFVAIIQAKLFAASRQILFYLLFGLLCVVVLYLCKVRVHRNFGGTRTLLMHISGAAQITLL